MLQVPPASNLFLFFLGVGKDEKREGYFTFTNTYNSW